MPDTRYENPRPAIPAEIVRSVKVEAGHNCAIKGCPEHTYLEIHHINQNREDNRLENLILLCDKHHKMAHADVIDNKSLFEYKKLLKNSASGSLQERFEELESMVARLPQIWASKGILNKTINLVLEEAVQLGNDLGGTTKGNKVAQEMFDLIRSHGKQMGPDSVELMVSRGETYSRTGLSGLGILYDHFFEYTKSLNLIWLFEQHGLQEVAYYCALREHFPNFEDFTACLHSDEFEWGGLRVAVDSGYFLSNYPNRGPSSVLDCLVRDGDSGEIYPDCADPSKTPSNVSLPNPALDPGPQSAFIPPLSIVPHPTSLPTAPPH